MIPAIVLDLTGKTADGPNCWNATRMYLGIDPEPRFVEQHEMDVWLAVFTDVVDREELHVGDIMVVHNRYGELLHTAVCVGSGAYWHKGGCSPHYHWEFTSEQVIREDYDRILNGPPQYSWVRCKEELKSSG